MMPNSRRIPRSVLEVALSGAHPLASQSMQRLQLLLLEGLDRYGANL